MKNKSKRRATNAIYTSRRALTSYVSMW